MLKCPLLKSVYGQLMDNFSFFKKRKNKHANVLKNKQEVGDNLGVCVLDLQVV